MSVRSNYLPSTKCTLGKPKFAHECVFGSQ